MKNKFGHLMIDLETLGTKSNSVILSIGAVEFDINTGQPGEVFYEKIDFQSALNCGLTVEASTIMWWMKQNEQARMELADAKGKVLNLVLIEFAQFIKKLRSDNIQLQVWGNSARFDLGLLNDAYRAVNMDIPWDFRDERCVRTLVSFEPEIKKQTKFRGAEHNALDDCYHQIKYCSEIWNSIKQKQVVQ